MEGDAHHDTPEAALACKEQLGCIQRTLIPAIQNTIEQVTPKPQIIPDFSKIINSLKRNQYMHSTDCMKEITKVLQRYRTGAAVTLAIDTNGEGREEGEHRENLAKKIQKNCEEISACMPVIDDEEEYIDEWKVFMGPSRNCTPETYMQSMHTIELLGIKKETKIKDLANTYLKITRSPSVNSFAENDL